MKEASRTKYYFARYFFLAFGGLQWICGILILRESSADKSRAAALLFFLIGLVMLSIHLAIATRLKRVAVGKNRIAVISNGEIVHYEWPEVKWIRPLSMINVYKLKLRGKKRHIYFLPKHPDDPVFGLTGEREVSPESLRKKSK